ncbi:CAAX prenyl protease-related protein [Desulfuromonas acetoxidans]|uniref:Abortive infection protein n=1 Tax=Desulfuromonas acetoxidans (strain DSM 684 / 11070) TaxID=281689 RepID=Q1K3X4_DESA6|nr:CAAX prenyl protease-related protein [Desulfuromonas acetoxidans]EAT17329.1 Abortive infection protein [Desulfuromonas acetoxidans DSM 684]MBF0644288.1 CAAX prenyl protease-related protein [Desulfuromonas acetoxidans]NVD24842.1 CAAX prenyl protease-related protein [Desulfuromonas acetoxidans]NVE15143.1 CAAX prenyl protease-related protein [Desulfuromonas acetoxidans]
MLSFINFNDGLGGILQKNLWTRVLPFALYMAFIGIEDGLRYLVGQSGDFSEASFLYLYPVKVGLVAAVLVVCWRHYREVRFSDLLQWRHTVLSIAIGGGIFWLWIHMTWDFATLGESQGFNPNFFAEEGMREMMVIARLFGAVLVVPVMEEIFWRSFLIRYAIDGNFMQVAIGRFSVFSFLVTTVLFGLEHHLFLAGMAAGALFNFLLYRTRSIAQCILSHFVANLALGLYVLRTEQWQFW